MLANSTAVFAEGIRQGQAETELRVLRMKMISSASGNVTTNPCNSYYNNDREVARLGVDSDRLENLVKASCLRSPLCFLPCFWPHSILLCMPCSVYSQAKSAKKAARAHKLVLRENSLALTVDPYPQKMRVSTVQVLPCGCLNCIETSPIEEVIPLVDIDSVKVEECKLIMCGMPIAPDTLVVRINGSQFPIFAVDMPMEGEKFAALVMKQVQHVKAQGSQMPEAWNEYKLSLCGFGSAQADLMGVLGGVMQQQRGVQMNHMMQMNIQGVSPGQVQMNAGNTYNPNNMGVGNAAGMFGNVNQAMGGPTPMTMGNAAGMFANVNPNQAMAGPTPMTMDARAVPVVAEVTSAPPPYSSSSCGDIGTELTKLADLKSSGVLSEGEYQAAKNKLLGL